MCLGFSHSVGGYVGLVSVGALVVGVDDGDKLGATTGAVEGESDNVTVGDDEGVDDGDVVSADEGSIVGSVLGEEDKVTEGPRL